MPETILDSFFSVLDVLLDRFINSFFLLRFRSSQWYNCAPLLFTHFTHSGRYSLRYSVGPFNSYFKAGGILSPPRLISPEGRAPTPLHRQRGAHSRGLCEWGAHRSFRRGSLRSPIRPKEPSNRSPIRPGHQGVSLFPPYIEPRRDEAVNPRRSFLKGFGAFFLMPPPYSWRKREPMEGHPDTA